jgi:hypothetical protein
MFCFYCDGPDPDIPDRDGWKFIRNDYSEDLSYVIKRESLATFAKFDKTAKTLVIGKHAFFCTFLRSMLTSISLWSS